MKIKNNYWTWRLIKAYNEENELSYVPTNFCDYFRKVSLIILGLFAKLLMALAIVWNASNISWVMVAVASMIVLAPFFVLLLIMLIYGFVSSKSKENETLTLLKTKYSSVKNKYCPIIEFEEDVNV